MQLTNNVGWLPDVVDTFLYLCEGLKLFIGEALVTVDEDQAKKYQE